MMAFLNEQKKIIREVKIMKNVSINNFFNLEGQIFTIFQYRGRMTSFFVRLDADGRGPVNDAAFNHHTSGVASGPQN